MNLTDVIVIIISTALLVPSAAASTEIRCPQVLDATEPQVTPFEPVGEAPREPHRLRGASILTGTPGAEQRAAPAMLAPDDLVRKSGRAVSIWRLPEYRAKDGLLLICRYAGTDSYLRAVIPETVKTCSMYPSGPMAMICR
jgi:hypothetical protein